MRIERRTMNGWQFDFTTPSDVEIVSAVGSSSLLAIELSYSALSMVAKCPDFK